MKKHLKLFLWLVAVTLGALETWANRYAVNPDGVSYLDIGDAYFRGDWGAAINGYWSPLYSWLLGGAAALINPATEWEYPLAHFVNFIIYLGALVCFNFFLTELIQSRKAQPGGDEVEHADSLLPSRVFLPLGYVIFIWASFVLIPPTHIVPDMCVAALVYLAAALLLRIRRDADVRLYALLGLVLGFGYLTKTAMFLVAFPFLAVGAVLAGSFRKAWPRLLVALGCCALVAAPFVAALSTAKGRLTFGDTGKLAYAWYVNEVPSRHWQGGDVVQGVPAHPTRRVLASPAVYEFGSPIKATYALWYDPSYWYEGVAVRFNLRRQLQVFGDNLRHCLTYFSLQGGLIIVGLLSLFSLRRDRRALAKSVMRQWFLLLPAFAALAMYALVHIERRLVAPFMVLMFVAVIAGIHLPAERRRRRLTTLALVAVILASIGPAILRRHLASVRQIVRNDYPQREYLRVAEDLKRLGLRPGERIASLGYANPYNAQWARLAKVHIVAEMYDEKEVASFWRADSGARRQVIDAFAQTGADLIVASNVTKETSADGWQQLEGTDTYVYFLSSHRSFESPR